MKGSMIAFADEDELEVGSPQRMILYSVQSTEYCTLYVTVLYVLLYVSYDIRNA